ncbi:succinyldiaminopimelate transaminase [Brevibacterium sp. 5221]|uniref:Aminotransferase n=1 Tax=Brevibacterium rongguiense TaxID=2695267 RepID=A0A6N9HAI3_9MICO|nr:succinyldiaminopimelate transaminase [Brevibacterium rongguiense]MYM20806.1 succinyldiaminopimelate transaminase [Brevibacterium rongguiense]
MTGFGLGLAEYPWELLAPYRARAQERGPVCDLSIGTPVDPTPPVIREALAAAADWPGYPQTAGTPELREAIADWYRAWHGVELDPHTQVIPSVGSKEFIALLPLFAGLRQRGLALAGPSVGYPTYEMGAELAGVDYVRLDAEAVAGGASLAGIGLLWLNTPGNPSGAVLAADLMRDAVAAARAAGVVVASDECYGLLNWAGPAPAPSVLSRAVVGDDHTGVLSVYSMSKESNLAGYRAAFAAGDPQLIADLTNSRKHAGLIVPGPVQAAMVAGLRDQDHVRAQKDAYRRRRAVLEPAVRAFGLRIDDSEAGLYLWSTAGEDCWTTIGRLADLGIIAAPGIFYGEAGSQHVRIALTAPDDVIAAAAERLRG